MDPFEQIIEDRVVNKWFGIYSGRVVSIDDPEKVGRILLSCPAITGSIDQELPNWAWPMPAFGGSNGNYGFFSLPCKSDMVWVQFIDGDIDKPVWHHGPWGYNNGVNSVPRHARGVPDNEDVKGNDVVPNSNYAGEYGKVYVLKTPSGHSLEFDDTPGNERVLWYHKSGSQREVLSDGTTIDIANGNRREHTAGKTYKRNEDDVNETIIGNKTETIEKNYSQTINGSTEYYYLGGVKYTLGKHEINSDGDANVSAKGNMIYTCNSNHSHTIGGSRTIQVVKSELHQIMEYAIWAVNNANAEAQALLIKAYSGALTLASTDSTGMAKGGYFDTDPVNNILRLYQSTLTGKLNPSGQSKDSLGAGLILDGANNKATLHAMTELLLASMKIAIESKSELSLKGATVKMEADGTIEIKGNGPISIDGNPFITIGGTSAKALVNEDFLTQVFIPHIHSAPLIGQTGPSTIPALPGVHSTTKLKGM